MRMIYQQKSTVYWLHDWMTDWCLYRNWISCSVFSFHVFINTRMSFATQLGHLENLVDDEVVAEFSSSSLFHLNCNVLILSYHWAHFTCYVYSQNFDGNTRVLCFVFAQNTLGTFLSEYPQKFDNSTMYESYLPCFLLSYSWAQYTLKENL